MGEWELQGDDREEWLRRRREQRERYEAELLDSSRRFATFKASSDVIHDKDCPVVLRHVRSAYDDLDRTRYCGSSHFPWLVDRAEADRVNSRRCRVCAPNVRDKIKRGPPIKNSGNGWPEIDGHMFRRLYGSPARPKS
jgi:hypothetical protein